MARRRSRVTGPLRPLVGGAVLVGTVRIVDALWTRLSGRRPPLATGDVTADGAVDPAATGGVRSDPAGDGDASPRVVRDRLLYALLLGGALRLARRAGLQDDDDEGQDDRDE